MPAARLLVGVALALLGAVGCQSDRPAKGSPVTGKVVYKGTGEAATRLAGGYVCLQSHSKQAEFKNVRIKALK